jgi:hypothetical protein
MTNPLPRTLVRYVLTMSVCLTGLLLSALSNNAQTGHRQTSLVTTASTNVTKTFDPTNPNVLIQQLIALTPLQFDTWLTSVLPTPVSPTLRDEAFPRATWLAQLQIVDDFKTCNRLQQQTLPLLRLFHREHSVRFFIYRDNYPNVQTVSFSYIGISTGLLDLLQRDTTGAQLNGLVAHELARDIVKDRFIKAWKHEDFQTIRQLELFHDVIAAIALHRLQLPSQQYAFILKQMSAHNTMRNDYAADSLERKRHPSLNDRQLVINTVALACAS